MSDNLQDYLTFKKMITPIVIQILFWLWVAGIVFSGLGMMFAGQGLAGLVIILIGPIIARIAIELIIVMFKINEGVQTIAKRDTTFD